MIYEANLLLASEEPVSHLQLAKMLIDSGKFSKYPIPTKGSIFSFIQNKRNNSVIESGTATWRPRFNIKKVREELGITLTPLDKSVVDMAEAMISLGIVSAK